jgi:hypothetical protein
MAVYSHIVLIRTATVPPIGLDEEVEVVPPPAVQ